MEDFIHEILTGQTHEEKSNMTQINLQVLVNVEKSLSLEQFNEKILECGTELERIKLVAQYFEWSPISQDILQNYTKNAETSTFLREKANSEYVNKNYRDALGLYNLAVNFSPWGANTTTLQTTEEGKENTGTGTGTGTRTGTGTDTVPESDSLLGLALANRSATLLLGLGEASLALLDIDLAIQNNYPPKLSHKLEDRRKKCEEILREREERVAGSAAGAEFDKRKRFCEGILFKVKRPNPKIPVAEEFVEVSWDPIRGRQLVVNRDIPAGTVLVVEKPFVSVLRDSVKWDLEHCHYCLRRLLRGVPCPQCVFVTYCDEGCREEALKEFHSLECPCLAELHLNSTPRYVLLALRIICKLGPYYILKLFLDQQVPPRKENGENQNGGGTSEFEFISTPNKKTDAATVAGAVYKCDSYEPIYNLVSHSSQLEPFELYSNAFQALVLSTMLEKYSLAHFLKLHDFDEGQKGDFMNFLASILLHHIENLPCNSMSLDELQGFEIKGQRVVSSLLDLDLALENGLGLGLGLVDLKTQIRSIKYPQIGAGVYAVASLMNHSCDPNVTRVNDRRWGRLAIVTTRGLRKGEEVLTCYSRSFISDARDKRQTYLSQNYYFECGCIACVDNWPLLSALMKKEPVLCCGKCALNFYHDQKSSSSMSNFKDCVIKRSGHYKCSLCRKSYGKGAPGPDMDLTRQMELFFEAYDLVLKNDCVSAVKGLMGPMKYFQWNVCPPFSKAYMVQDVYKQALELIVYFSQKL